MKAGVGQSGRRRSTSGGGPCPISYLEDVDGEDEVRGALVHLELAVAVLEGHKLLEEGREGVLTGEEGNRAGQK